MRIDPTIPAPPVRPMPIDDQARLAVRAAAAGPDVSAATHLAALGATAPDARAASLPAPAAPGSDAAAASGSTVGRRPSDLASEPRYAALIGLMERLTGRDVTLVPPASFVLGPKQARATEAPTAEPVHVTSVHAARQGDRLRIDAQVASSRSSEDLSVDLPTQLVATRRAEPLSLQVSEDAASSPSGTPLSVRPTTDGTATVVPRDDPHVDVRA